MSVRRDSSGDAMAEALAMHVSDDEFIRLRRIERLTMAANAMKTFAIKKATHAERQKMLDGITGINAELSELGAEQVKVIVNGKRTWV